MAGSKMLKVCGIITIIFGAISIVASILAVVGAGAGASYVAETGELGQEALLATGIILEVVIAAAVLSLVGSVIELIAGILGVKNWNKPEKATICVVFGIIVLALTVISLILSAVGGGTSSASIVISVICGLALPVLYLIGAIQLKKQAAPMTPAVEEAPVAEETPVAEEAPAVEEEKAE